jgi:acetyl-CoA synthetase
MINNGQLVDPMADQFDVKLIEQIPSSTPDPGYKQHAWIRDYAETYKESISNLDEFWGKVARGLDWFEPWDKAKEWKYPYAKWFTNAKLNITANCLDRHVKNHRRNKVALIWGGGGANKSNKLENVFEFKKYMEE